MNVLGCGMMLRRATSKSMLITSWLKRYHAYTLPRSFYKLSKVHHPDANPKNPSAAHTFSLISESYSLLSDPTRRATYDRDVLRLHQSSHSPNATPKGSYHSAGGRPATGLSRRRGTYKGPPPSFYRSGGYGTHGEKRRKAHEESTTTGGSADRGEGVGGGKQHGGMGPGDDPFGHQGDVPHFDRASHHKTQKREDDRRWQRTHRAVDEDDVEFEPQMSMGAHFIVIIMLLGVSFVVPALYLQFGRTGKKKREA